MSNGGTPCPNTAVGGCAIALKTPSGLDFTYRPRSQAQKDAELLWRDSRISFYIGPAGTGKSLAALAMTIRDALTTVAKETGVRPKIWLARPTVACDEDLGFLPGELDSKLAPWMNHFQDCFECMSTAQWATLTKALKIEMVSLGMIRGRTIRNGVLICDEMQNATRAQIKLVLTRLGEGSKIVICGDPDQSDRYKLEDSPMMHAVRRLQGLPQVRTLHFDEQLRDPLVGEILKRL